MSAIHHLSPSFTAGAVWNLIVVTWGLYKVVKWWEHGSTPVVNRSVIIYPSSGNPGSFGRCFGVVSLWCDAHLYRKQYKPGKCKERKFKAHERGHFILWGTERVCTGADNQARLSANGDGFTSLTSVLVCAELLNMYRDKKCTEDLFAPSLLCNEYIIVFTHGTQRSRGCLCTPNICCAPRKVRLSIQVYQIKDKFIF